MAETTIFLYYLIDGAWSFPELIPFYRKPGMPGSKTANSRFRRRHINLYLVPVSIRLTGFVAKFVPMQIITDIDPRPISKKIGLIPVVCDAKNILTSLKKYDKPGNRCMYQLINTLRDAAFHYTQSQMR
jgi:hypothetical protein